MKKLKKVIVLLLLGLCVLPFNVQALTGKNELSCSKTTVVPGDTITCTLKGNVSDGEVSSLSSKISTSTNLTLSGVVVDSIWEGADEANLDLYTDENKTGTFAIATFTVVVSKNITSGSNETVTIGSTKFYDKNYDEVTIADATESIKVLSTVNTLSSLTLSSGSLSPAFNSNTLNYSATVDAEKLTISAVKTDAKSTISGSVGEVKLNYGVNTFKINVTSESKSVKTYTISITRPDNRDTNNKLSSLVLNGSDIDLTDEVQYSYEVASDVNQIEIDATLSSDKASFVDGYEPKVVNLVEGENKIELKVMAENETVKTYTLIINRKSANNGSQASSGDNNITDDKIDNPKTGSLAIYIVIVIVIISIISGLYFYKQCQKKQVKDTNEKK